MRVLKKIQMKCVHAHTHTPKLIVDEIDVQVLLICMSIDALSYHCFIRVNQFLIRIFLHTI